MLRSFELSLFASLSSFALLAGCAATPEAKPPSGDDDVEVDAALEVETAELRADRANDPFRGALTLGETEADRLSRRLPQHYWTFEAEAGRQVFIDLASREGDDVFLGLYARSGRAWRLIGFNDDCYRGTLNACLEITLPEGGEFLVLATTYPYVAWRIPTPASYHVTVHCTDPAGCGGATLCGSRGLPACADGAFCAFEPGRCGADDVPGVCEPLPEACPAVWDPVCGCDGRTYSNACYAAMHGISVADAGECEAPGVGARCGGAEGARCAEGLLCDLSENAACGDDLEGTCREDDVTICPRVYDPECGCDGVTYGNSCEREGAGQPLAHRGVCGEACIVTGCSAHVCAEEEVITTCEWRDEYACFHRATCERQPDGECGWTPTDALNACLAGAGDR